MTELTERTGFICTQSSLGKIIHHCAYMMCVHMAKAKLVQPCFRGFIYWHQVRLGISGIWVINKYQCYVYDYIFSFRFLAHFFEAWL